MSAGFDTGFFAKGGKPYFLRNFGYFRTVEQTNSVIIILVIVYSSAIDQLKYSHFVCLPVYHYINIMHVFQCVRGFARGGNSA